MSKSDPIEKALDALGELRNADNLEYAATALRPYLNNRSNLVVARAAKMAGELHLRKLIPELVADFGRLMVNPQRLDKRCEAVTEIARALYQLDYSEPEVYLRGLHHVQKEASFGPPVDTASALRGVCAQGLVRTRCANALSEVLPLLIDPEPPARLGAIRALRVNGGEAGVLLLRLKVLTGDKEPEVLGECFSALLASAPEQSLPFVARYVDDDEETTVEAAIWALAGSRLSGAIDVLKDKWERTLDHEMRKVLLAALAASRQQESFDFLCLQLRTADARTAAEAIAALAPYANSEGIKDAVVRAVEERREPAVTRALKDHFRL